MQKVLAPAQTAAFYHDQFVETQARHFTTLLGNTGSKLVVVDVGGGCGFFANHLMHLGDFSVKVLDMDLRSIEACRELGVAATQSDALCPDIAGDEAVASFNLILHHLVGRTERDTRVMQSKALAVWQPHIQAVFVNEYIYESYLANFSGALIYQITKNAALSWLGQIVSKFVPSLKANTFGVGVRFRANKEWCQLFDEAGYVVTSCILGEREHISLPRRLLFIKEIRRDSFLLVPKPTNGK